MLAGSLFAGIGGFDLGFQLAGMETVWQVEIDKNCQNVLAKHWPDVARCEDVRDCGKHNLEPVDLICGGFPCQDLSVAGCRAGLAGERSGLWFEFARIIGEMRPRWCVIENVPGLLSSNQGRDMGTIVGALGQFGYWWAYRVLDAQYFGVAQRRRRVFIVASLGGGSPAEVLFEQESLRRDTPPSREARKETAAAVVSRIGKGGFTDPVNDNRIAVYSPSSFAVSREGVGTLREDAGGRSGGSGSVVTYTIQSNDGGDHKRKDRPNGGLYVKEADASLALGSSDQTVIAFQQNQREEVRNLGDVAGAIAAEPGVHQQNYIAFEPGNLMRRCGSEPNPSVVSTLGSTKVGDTFPCVAWEMSHASEAVRENGEIAPTLQQRMGTGGNQVPLVGVRRLTPTECERLQGFPDGWTDGQADSVRYRQLGNAVCVPVVEWIGRRIVSGKGI